MKKYPLKLKPVTKSAIWGGSRIPELFAIGETGANVAEAWMLTVRKDAVNLIENGPSTGLSLAEYIGINPAKEDESAAGDHFPLLVKLIDARDKLSVQVHPDDAYAALHGLDAGKTEMWYVLEAEKDASLVMGLKEGITESDIRNHAADGTLECDLKSVKVKKGDCFFIPAGTIHAIGGGILIAEIQQNSDTTYRLYDYDRTDKNGNKRELHLDAAIDAMKGVTVSEKAAVNTRVSEPNGVTHTVLCSCGKFKAESLVINAGKTYALPTVTDFLHVMCVGGIGYFECKDAKFQLKKGDSYYLPAGIDPTKITSERDLSLVVSRAVR